MNKVFAGRVIFDHIPKTGGQAVNAWLKSSLAPGLITENLTGNHTGLIRRWGGAHSIISAHVTFDTPGLDPRYQYLTCVREPIDRAVSWLFYMINNQAPLKLFPALRLEAIRFVDSEGQEGGGVLPHISDYQVRHFARVIRPVEDGAMPSLDDALMALEGYLVCGLYDRFAAFIAAIAGVIDIPPPAQLNWINVTEARPQPDDISSRLIDRLIELNTLDMALYARLRKSLKP